MVETDFKTKVLNDERKRVRNVFFKDVLMRKEFHQAWENLNAKDKSTILSKLNGE